MNGIGLERRKYVWYSFIFLTFLCYYRFYGRRFFGHNGKQNERDEEGLLRRGVHFEGHYLRGKKFPIKINVVSEDPRIEIATVSGVVYGKKKNIVFYYMKKDGKETLECHNMAGLHGRIINYLANELYWLKPSKIVPQDSPKTS